MTNANPSGTTGNPAGTSQAARIAAGAVAVAVMAGGIGYWMGRGTPGGVAPEASAAAAAAPGKKERKILYYRNPMGLPDTSPTPKKDPMGMDYIPVYEGGDDEAATPANQVRISTEKIQKLGVRTEVAKRQALDKTVRIAGRIEPDERRVYAITPKFEGYVERLHVNVTGQPVGKGQPLLEAYSPELVSAQREYAIAAQGLESLKGADAATVESMRQLAESSLQRLKNWDISEEQVKALAKSGEARRTLTFRSPAAGIVTEKKALQGMRFMPGEMLYQVADLSSVWVVADVFEQDIGLIRNGAKAKVRINAYPSKVFEGTVSYVYPTLQAETRTVPIRLDVANPGLLLKPGMFAQVELRAAAKAPAVVVPLSAVIDSGTRQIVIIEQGEGRFEPRDVKLGTRSDNDVEVVEGVKEGDRVVVAANFLIDAESNLKAAIGGFSAASPDGGQAAKSAGHHADGTVDSIDAKAQTISLNHGAIDSLNWPPMTMDFKVANASLLQGIRPGAAVAFEFVERQPGEWVITRLTPAASGAAARNPHAGH